MQHCAAQSRLAQKSLVDFALFGINRRFDQLIPPPQANRAPTRSKGTANGFAPLYMLSMRGHFLEDIHTFWQPTTGPVLQEVMDLTANVWSKPNANMIQMTSFILRSPCLTRSSAVERGTKF